MTFAHQLERLRRAAVVTMPGRMAGKTTVDMHDLRELLHHFDLIDAELRAIHQQAAPLSAALADIAAERRRQIEQEGWTPEHDDAHSDGQMATAAACYAISAHNVIRYKRITMPSWWPWDSKWWKPGTTRRDLVKAGALIAAEIERLDRAAQKGGEA